MNLLTRLTFKNIFSILILLFFITSCGPLAYKRADVKDSPINDADKRKRNIEQGRGFTIPIGKSDNGGNFSFANSNELWRATLEILDFAPLSDVDYSGGLIVTDWYSDGNNSNESIKISVQFLSDEIRADGINVKIYQKKCSNQNNCTTSTINSNLNDEIKLAILKKASELKLKK